MGRGRMRRACPNRLLQMPKLASMPESEHSKWFITVEVQRTKASFTKTKVSFLLEVVDGTNKIQFKAVAHHGQGRARLLAEGPTQPTAPPTRRCPAAYCVGNL